MTDQDSYILQLYPEEGGKQTCTCCGKSLPVEDFYAVKQNHKLKFKPRSSAKERTSRCKSCIKLNKKKLTFERYLWTLARNRAKKNNLEFSIDINDIVIPEVCPVFGFELKRNEKSIQQNSATLDRIDNSKGYVKGNIQVISYLANTMKNQATDNQLIMFCEWITRLNSRIQKHS